MKNFAARSATFIAIGFVVIALYSSSGRSPSEGPPAEEVSGSLGERLPESFRLIGENAFSGSLTREELAEVSKMGFRVVVRLNGEGKDSGGLSIEKEAEICRRLKLRFYYVNIEGDIQGKAEDLSRLLSGGNVLVHCRNGAHRAPAIVGYYLKKQNVPTRDIVSEIGWEDLINNPGPYQRYTRILIP